MATDWNVLIAVGTFGQFLVVLVAAFLGLRQLEHLRHVSPLVATILGRDATSFDAFAERNAAISRGEDAPPKI